MGKWILEGGIAIKRIYVFNQINIYKLLRNYFHIIRAEILEQALCMAMKMTSLKCTLKRFQRTQRQFQNFTSEKSCAWKAM